MMRQETDATDLDRSSNRALVALLTTGHDVFVELKRSRVPEFLLVSRGFHWINEFPDNE